MTCQETQLIWNDKYTTQSNEQQRGANVNLKSMKRKLRDVLSCLALAKEDNELPEMLQMLEQAARLVVTESVWVDLSYQEDSHDVDKNFYCVCKRNEYGSGQIALSFSKRPTGKANHLQ